MSAASILAAIQLANQAVEVFRRTKDMWSSEDNDKIMVELIQLQTANNDLFKEVDAALEKASKVSKSSKT